MKYKMWKTMQKIRENRSNIIPKTQEEWETFQRKRLDLELSKYGIDGRKYSELLQQQQGVCAICKGVNKGGKRLYVDHCHITGKVRGLLCRNCNTMLGNARDDIYRLKAAIKYLENK